MRLRDLLTASAALTLLAFAACDANVNVATPNAFDRPESVAFFCWSFEADAPVALEECAPREIVPGENDFAEPRDGFALHALVTQTGTGEVAAVRLSGDSAEGEPGVIDSDVRVPGFTFVAVGDVPSGLAISRIDPKHVFVVSRGSAEINVIEVAAFRKGLGVAVETVRPAGIVAGARPSAVLLTPDETALLIALPIAGQVARVPILGDGQLGDAELLDLMAPEPEPVDLTALDPADLPADYIYTCAVEPAPAQPAPIAPRTPQSRGDTPQPWSFLADPETGEIFVADRNRPVIHRIDPTTFTELPPIAVSVPTRALAISPRVPASLDALTPTERYLYAIDETDRTVLAVDLSDPARSTYGSVLPVSVTAPRDRLDAVFPARGLAVVSPTYDPQALSFCTNAEQGELAGSTSLHGVFLTVATVDGRIRFFDIYDLDTPCRGTECAATATNPDPADIIAAIGRHRPRLQGRLSEPVQIDPGPSWGLRATSAVLVADDGLAEGAPTLAPVECTEGLSQVFPITGAQNALVCAVADPWTAINQSFTATYEGRLPSAGTTGANIDAVEPFFEVRFDPCASGAIGSLDVPDEGALAGYAGDVVAITGDLPPSILEGDEQVLDRCEELTERTVGGVTNPVILPLLRAATRPDGLRDSYTGRLDVGDPVSPAGFTLDDVRTCFPELLQLEVRVAGVYTVTSTRAGFRHPITRAEDDGRCVVDPVAEAARSRGRVACGETYRSPEVTFSFDANCPADLVGSVLEFTVGGVPIPLTIDVSSFGGTDRESLLEGLVYNPIDERLYAVDQSVQGLMRIRLSDLNVQQTFR